jgi:alpha-L-rhamnosidase
VRIEAIVPPNTTAVVVLPDGREFEIGSGSHEWTVTDDAPAPVTPPVGLHSSLAAVIDDTEAYRTILEVLEASDSDAAELFRTTTKWIGGRQLGESLFHATPAMKQQIADRLDQLSARRAEASVHA